MCIDVFMLTRFNVRLQRWIGCSGENWLGGDEAYLRRRLALFKRYTFPSMSAQTDVRVRWLVLLSSLTPEWFRKEMIALAKQNTMLEPIYLDDRTAYTEEEEGDVIAAEIAKRYNRDCKYVLTMRIDNDDAINVRFCEMVRRAAESVLKDGYGHSVYLISPEGCAYEESDAVLQQWRRLDNHFPALLTVAASPEHVMRLSHSKILKSGCQFVYVDGPSMWLEVVHGGNQQNHFHSQLLPMYRRAAWMRTTFGIHVTVDLFRFLELWPKIFVRMLWRQLQHRLERLSSCFEHQSTEAQHDL